MMKKTQLDLHHNCLGYFLILNILWLIHLPLSWGARPPEGIPHDPTCTVCEQALNGCHMRSFHLGPHSSHENPQPTGPKFLIIGDGRNSAELDSVANDAHHLYDLAVRLGYNINNNVIRLSDATDMAAITCGGGHPAPHFNDGLEMVKGSTRAYGIYEVVMPGNQDQQYIRSTNSVHDNRLVLAHVAGHYHFSENSPLMTVRHPDPIQSSLKLAQLMSRLYRTVDRDEVGLFYQQLLSLKYLQDVTSGTFQPPSDFSPGIAAHDGLIDQFGRPLGSRNSYRHPKNPTSSVLQAFVENLPAAAPQWKKDMAHLFEQYARIVPAYIHGKIMNEGWAVLSEYILLGLSRFQTTNDLVEFGLNNEGVRRAQLSNPYWLGGEVWLRTLDRFLKQPSIKNLAPEEQIRRFVTHATNIIAHNDDFSFIREGLDHQWVERQRLFLKRPLTVHEQRQRAPGTPDQSDPTHIAITRDPQRVINWISQITGNKSRHFARILLDTFNDQGSGAVRLVHEPYQGIPLRRSTLAKALFMIAQTLEHPITIATIGSVSWYRQKIQLPPWMLNMYRHYGIPIPSEPVEQDWDTFPLEVTVTPAGQVSLKVPSSSAITPPEDFLTKMKGSLQRGLDSFRGDISLSFSSLRSPVGVNGTFQRFLNFFEGAHNDSISRSMRMSLVAPTAPEAIREFVHTKALRTARIMDLALNGERELFFPDHGKTSVQLRIYPEIPHIELDPVLQRKRRAWIRPTLPTPNFQAFNSHSGLSPTTFWGLTIPTHTPGERAESSHLYAHALDPSYPDEDLVVDQGDHNAGDTWHEDSPEEDGSQGQSEDGDESDDEEGEDGDADGDDPSQGTDGKSKGDTVSIPIELYGELLAEKIRLRNLRRTPLGEDQTQDEIQRGIVYGDRGELDESRTNEEVISTGLALWRNRNRRPTARELFRLGFPYLQPQDHVSRAWDPEPEPDTTAVMVWVRDWSGSMSPDHVRIISNFIANARAVLKTVHPKLKEHFVTYDSDAQEVSEKDFFGKSRGGGTETSSALKLTQQILERYPRVRVNRFVSVFSDGDDGNTAASLSEARKLVDMADHMSYGHIDPMTRDALSQLSQTFADLSQEHPDLVGFAKLDATFRSVLKALQTFYGQRSVL